MKYTDYYDMENFLLHLTLPSQCGMCGTENPPTASLSHFGKAFALLRTWASSFV